LNQEEVLN